MPASRGAVREAAAVRGALFTARYFALMQEKSPTPDALEKLDDLGNGVTIAVCMRHGRPWGSEGFVERRYAAASTWADRLIAWQMNYTDNGEARPAAERLAEERG